MASRTTSYKRIKLNFPATGTGQTPVGEVAGTKGKPIISVTVLFLSVSAQDSNGLGWLLLGVGEGADTFRVQSQGLQWNAQQGPDGHPIPETTGLFAGIGDTNNAGAAPLITAELYVEFKGSAESV